MRLHLLIGYALASLCLTLSGALRADEGTTRMADAYRRLYVDGVLPDGRTLRATREPGGEVEGADAACANCHKRSGFGTTEGALAIPPVIAPYLFRRAEDLTRDLTVPHFPGQRPVRPPYDGVSLARAIREGVASDGRVLHPLMPRYELDPIAAAGLVDYLGRLPWRDVPGVADDALHFATVLAPDADPAAGRAVVEVIERYFADHNRTIGALARPVASSGSTDYRVARAWRLHVWRLEGEAESWERQLASLIKREPVFALLSGLGGRTWAPVHRFCEREAVPCLLPIVDLPEDNEGDFYPMYFSAGVLLEARILGARMARDAPSNDARAISIARAGDIGIAAARELSARLGAAGPAATLGVLSESPVDGDVGRALSEPRPGDAVVLWLRPEDLHRLPAAPPAGVTVYLSGLMARADVAALPAAWRDVALMAYPMQLPERRSAAMNYPLGWMKGRRIAPTAEWSQVHAWLACQILSDTLTEMLDAYSREYLVERVESMLSHRVANAYYPRLSLAPGQRFASKGGYVVRFRDAGGSAMSAEGDWVVP